MQRGGKGRLPPQRRHCSESLVASTVEMVMQMVRDHQPAEAVSSARTAWLVRRLLASSGENDTHLRLSPDKLAVWLNGARQGMRRECSSEMD